MNEVDRELIIENTSVERIATFVAVTVPFLGLIAAIYGLWGWGVTWVELVSLVVMYLATGMGITVGYHRLFTHRAFEAVRPVKYLLAVLGSMAVQGPVLRWVAIHRRHHHHSDQPNDPHSPNMYGGGVRGVLAGFWHAQVGWMFKGNYAGLDRYIRDLSRDKLTCAVSRLFGLWILLGLLIPAGIGGLLTGTWTGVLLGFLWGGLVRIFLVQHVTFSVNSICHLWGTRTFDNNDHSRNNLLVGVLALGEGWHNNHHAFPASARHGLRWWQFDASYYMIRVMAWLRLVWSVRLPQPEAIIAKRPEVDALCQPAEV